MTEAQCEGWADGAVASGYPAGMLERQVAGPYWGGGLAPRFDYKNDWRAIMPFSRRMLTSPVSASPSTWVIAPGSSSRTLLCGMTVLI